MEIKDTIHNLIKEKGYITISEFMIVALTSYPNSYYRAKNPFDYHGDFITSPEVSQIFGEILGVWVYQQWINKNKPSTIYLVELGPGRGVLMRDLLRAISHSEMFNSVSVVLYDVNEVLIEEQKKNLKFFNRVKWIDKIEKFPQETSIFISNEFFDALPINQYVKENGRWYELVLMFSEENNIIFDKILTSDLINDRLNHEHKNSRDGAIVEESKITAYYIKLLADHSENYNSISLIIDYGYNIEPSSRKNSQYLATLQAIKKHKYTILLDDIGSADISAHVDFYAIQKTAIYNSKVKTTKVITQREFLQKNGIEIRFKDLLSRNPSLSNVLNSQYSRLVSKNQMGDLFKVIAIHNINENVVI